MKKFFSISLVLILLISSAFIDKKVYAVKLGYTCQDMQVAVDSVYGSYDGDIFLYQINYCSQTFSSSERYIKFTMTFVDKAGNILAETSTGPAITKSKSGEHSAGISLNEEPYDCIISWSYNDGQADEWHIMDIRSLKLFKKS